MTYQQLTKSLADPEFDNFDTTTEQCLWQARVHGWQMAHIIVETLPEPAASWIHAMLHRAEGDRGNAMYWYSRANKEIPAQSLSYEQEWQQVAQALLGR